MFVDLEHKCDVCGKLIASYGCCIYGDEKDLCKEDLCETCKKSVRDALEQKRYLESR